MKKPEKIAKSDIIPKTGERALIVGATGSGKTGFACFILERLETVPIIIYDTKEENKFTALPGSIVVQSQGELEEALGNPEIDYIVYRPSLEITVDPDLLDDLLLTHYHRYRETVAYIDEVYQFHKGGKCGPGLIGLLTRGRSRGITTIISTQRPSYLSRFCITESQKFYIFSLIDKQDKKRIGDVVPDFANLSDPVKFGFWYYHVGDDAPKKYQPIKLAPEINKGYVDEQAPVEVAPDLEKVVTPKATMWIR